MLKSLLKDVCNSIRRSTPHKHPTAPAEQLEDWRTAYRGASTEARAALFARVNAYIADHPNVKQGWTLRADWLLQEKRLAESEHDYRRALQLDPLSPAAQEGIGLALLQIGRLDEAYLHLELAHKLQPMNSDVLTHWGLVALEMGNLEDAQKKFERAVERNVENPHAWHNLGLVAIKRHQSAKAVEYLQRAISLKPDHGLAYSNIALAYRDDERIDEAVAAARRAVQLKKESARIWVVLGDVLVDAGEFSEAEQALLHAAQLDPSLAAPYIGLGKLYTGWARHTDAEGAYSRALQLVPGEAEATAGLAQAELLQGRFASGWDHYEARKHTSSAPVRQFPFVEWEGESLAGRTILVHAEQGLGDIILFASCVPDLVAQGASVILETDPRLATIFKRSFDGATVVGHDSREGGPGWLQELQGVERHASLGSLPRFLRRSYTDFPRHTGYLRADPELIAKWREKIAAEVGSGPVIGVAWRGGLIRSGGRQRSLPLDQLLTAVGPTGAHVISLQYGNVDEEVRAANARPGVRLTHWPEALRDQDEVAALTCALDAVVTVCSTQAHLTGALGQPGCVLVPASPNWRYGASGTSTPWYPSLTLARQARLGDWSDGLAAAEGWLAQRLGLRSIAAV
jgi:Tfp pilus assembly protein PilF